MKVLHEVRKKLQHDYILKLFRLLHVAKSMLGLVLLRENQKNSVFKFESFIGVLFQEVIIDKNKYQLCRQLLMPFC